MNCLPNLAACAVFLLSQSAWAVTVQEMSRDELQVAIGEGRAVTPGNAVAAVSERIEGDAVDIRVFAFEGVYYRVLVKQPDGKMVSVILDAERGQLVANDSGIARSVDAAASAGVLPETLDADGQGQ